MRLSRHWAAPADARRRAIAAGLLTSTAVAGLVACGAQARDAVVARVGQVTITSGAVEHWMTALAEGRPPSSSTARNALREQALDFLISSDWLLGQAAADGLSLSETQVQRQLALQRSASFPGGLTEMEEFLKATGRTRADLLLQARTELAAAMLRQAVAGRQPPVAEAQVVRFYARHRQLFTIPERRTIEFTNRKSRAAALAVRREVAAGRPLASFGVRMTIPLSPLSYSLKLGPDATLARAVHFARPDVLTGPVLTNHIDHYVFEVKSITPARVQPLSQVRRSIVRRLAAASKRRALAAFVETWRRRWMARTTCSPGYVVQKCRQFSGTRKPEDPDALD
jgi:foldase protein PrsA